MSMIEAPTHCPSCNSVLVWVNHLLYCKNSACESQSSKKIEHFAKTLKIKGLGPSTIAKLGLSDISDCFMLSECQIAELLSSEKLAEKLYAEINNAKKAPLNFVLPAFSIPLIGKTATEKLSTVCNSIYEINEDICKAAGLGPKATESLLEWFEFEFKGSLDKLPLNFFFEKSASPVKVNGCVCISGKLKTYKTKAEAAAALTSLGYEVKDSFTKQVTILVNESGIESAKTKQARDSGVLIVTDLLSFIGEMTNGNPSQVD